MFKCIIRIDIAHLMNATCWKYCNDKHVPIKDFFARCIVLLSQSTNFHTFKHICQNILTVAFSETEDIETNNNLFSCFDAQQWLIIRIKMQDLKYDEDFSDNDDDDNGNNSEDFD